MRPDLVTVAVTTHDRREMAQRAVSSALAQEGVPVEVVVVDDGSDPAFDPGTDPRIRLVRRAVAGGPCAARNAALAVARGSWITFLDDDDTLAPAMLARALEAAASSDLPPPIAVLSGIALVDDEGRVVGQRIPVRLPRGRHYLLEGPVPGRSYQTHNSLVVPTELLRAVGGWDEHLLGTEHDDLFLRLNAVCSIEAVEELTYRMRVHQGVRRSKDLLARAEAMDRTVRRHPEAFAVHPERHARYLTTMGITYLRAGRWREAVIRTSRAVRLRPGSGRAWVGLVAALAGPGTWRVLGRLRRGVRR